MIQLDKRKKLPQATAITDPEVSIVLTAIVFSLIPPTGSILPVSETSPVMATFWRTGWLVARDSRAVTIVQPALGPSLGVAP